MATLCDSTDGVFSPPGLGERVLPVAAIYGANASGKTAVIRALEFMTNVVKLSHSRWEPNQRIPVEPFAGDGGATPSEFSVDFLLDGIRHQYGFAADSQAIRQEWLYVYPKGKRQLWFRRADGKPMAFGAKMPGDNRTTEQFVRKNSLFLSTAAQNNHQALSPVYDWLSRSVSFVIGHLALWGRAIHRESAAAFVREAGNGDEILGLLSRADLGITGLAVEETPLPELSKKFLDLIGSAMPPGSPAIAVPETRKIIRLTHRVGDRDIPFEAEQESNGTLTYLALIGPIVNALKSGSVLCVDELDASLHPHIAAQVMRLFNNPDANPRNAQLIFNTHDTNLLSSGVLRRDQVWFTEKDAAGSSHLYPLTDYKPRRQENLETGYLQGRYGAIPFIHPDFLAGNPDGPSEKK